MQAHPQTSIPPPVQKPSPIPELIHRLNEAMFSDVARLRRRLHAIEIARRDRRLDHIPKLESDFRRELFTSIDRRDHRAKPVLQSKFDQDLPISPEKLDNQSSRSVVKIPACDNTTETEPFERGIA